MQYYPVQLIAENSKFDFLLFFINSPCKSICYNVQFFQVTWALNQSNTKYFNYRTVRRFRLNVHCTTYTPTRVYLSIYKIFCFSIRHANYIEVEFDFLSTTVIQSETCELNRLQLKKVRHLI